MEPNFLTVQEVADVLRVSQLTIYRYITANKLTAYKFGRDYRIFKADLNEFIQARKVKPK